jgi:arylsulfatase
MHAEPIGTPHWATSDSLRNADGSDTGGADGLTRWETTLAQALSEAGYATAMWGKWHLGSDPEQRSPVDFGFDEAVWSPRTADEVLWTMQSYFPDGPVSAEPYARGSQITIESEPIYARRKGGQIRDRRNV